MLKPVLTAVSSAVTALALGTVFAVGAQTATPADATATTAATTTTATQPGGHPHHHHHHHSPMAAALHQLDLTADQRSAIQQIFASTRSQRQAEHASARSRHQAFAALDPAAADYQQQVNGFADEAAAAARQRVQDGAQIKSQVIALLTPAQKAQFLAALAQPPHAHHDAPSGTPAG